MFGVPAPHANRARPASGATPRTMKMPVKTARASSHGRLLQGLTACSALRLHVCMEDGVHTG